MNDKPKYTKPVARSLGGVSAAEGSCMFVGSSVLASTSNFCSTGPVAYGCGPGATPRGSNPPGGPICFATGTSAGICYATGSVAYG